MNINLSLAEIEAFHNLAEWAITKGRLFDGPLVSGQRKLERVAGTKLCRHCCKRISRRKDRICDACNTYRSTYGKLPPEAVLDRRLA